MASASRSLLLSFSFQINKKIEYASTFPFLSFWRHHTGIGRPWGHKKGAASRGVHTHLQRNRLPSQKRPRTKKRRNPTPYELTRKKKE
ncbi:hypothetical protein [Pandoravirus japonicus]|uniref:Uncharacterized protein n=1 Tax=Pandoravirus japonicus TaxID=2823154 RepID=A0A811BQA9_9VIRU|nr:hypothetical protein [Pandoravirus japonicus]